MGSLKTIDAEVPPGLAVHLILDNYATHKHPVVERWLLRHKRFHLHYLAVSNDNPKPFVGTATVNSILEKVRRGRVVLQQQAVSQ